MADDNSTGLRQFQEVFFWDLKPRTVEFDTFHLLITCPDEVSEGDLQHQPVIITEVRTALRQEGYNAFCLHDLRDLVLKEDLSVKEAAIVSNAVVVIQTESCGTSISDEMIAAIETLQCRQVNPNSDLRINYFEPADRTEEPLTALLTPQIDLPDNSIHPYESQAELISRIVRHSKNIMIQEGGDALSPDPGTEYQFGRDWKEIFRGY